MALVINNINGVIEINSSRYYYGGGGTSGKFYPSIKGDNGFEGFLINIGGDYYEVKWEDLVIDGTSPESLLEAQNLLTILFTS